MSGEVVTNEAWRLHGGPDAWGVPKHDFSTNGNACGPCPFALAALQRCDAGRYPDPSYTALREQLAGFHGVDPARILSAGSLRSVTQVATWPGAGEALGDALAAALACAVPARTGDTVALDRGVLVRSGPEEFLLLSGQSTDMRTLLHQHIAPATGSVTDLSHARCQIHITGDKCRDTLSKLFALDLREQQFPLEQVRLTGHHHVPCLLHRRGVDSFDIYVFTTYAFDQLVTLVDAAREYGVSLAVSHAHGAV